MNNLPILLKLRNFSLFLVILFFAMVFFTLPINAEPEDCEGGTPGIGGPNIPDLPSVGFPDGDGCVDEVDLAVLLHCWGLKIENAPPPPVPPDTYPEPWDVCLVEAVTLFSVTIDPSPDTFNQGARRTYEIEADGGIGVPAGDVTFSVNVCPGSATCTFNPTFCEITEEGGECTVTLILDDTDTLSLGAHQIIVTGDHEGGFTDNATLNLTVVPPANIFVTSLRYSGDLVAEAESRFGCQNIEPTYGYDLNLFSGHCLCTRLAESSPYKGLKPGHDDEAGEWHAWLSHRSFNSPSACQSPPRNFNANYYGNVPSDFNQGQVLVNPGAQIVANQLSDLWSGNDLLNPIDYNERGNPVTTNLRVWTGTDVNGNCTGNTCTRWTEPLSHLNARAGTLDETSSQWTSGGNDSCWSGADDRRLYCIWFDDEIPTDWGLVPLAPVIIKFDVIAGSAIISWEVKSGMSNTPLDRIEIWRAPDNGAGAPGDWVELTELRRYIPGTNPNLYTGTATDFPTSGTWWYGLHVIDDSDEIGIEDNPISLVVPAADPVP